ncbi:hypothetical protein EST38_g4455 [Candolleomyces aberdarensis]|uniref:Uncharacterized protein n=1 Tax=Candolleomyces aberdarensis TaxID=2316362 RepID=A0A4Q2DR77_9AGAR|nr:hypothetical protein EST38_g4455 [Candolleomyces aberdarensis]
MAKYFQTLFKSTSPGHWQELYTGSNKEWMYLASSSGLGLVIMIGDALLVYRCYIVCVEYWWVTILPMMTSLSALVLFFMMDYPTGQDNSTVNYSAASTLLTVSTNIIVTTLITIRLLCARRTLANLLPSADVRVYTGVITILIESAAPLTIFGIITAVTSLLFTGGLVKESGGSLVCVYLFQGLFYSFCALSPHMIIFGVTTGRSFTKFPSAKDGVPTNPLQFARRTAESSFLQSTLNREFGQNCEADTEKELNGNTGEPTQTQTSIIIIGREKRNDSGDVEKVG